MNAVDVLGRLVLARHVPMRDAVFGGVEQKFIICFDWHGNEVPIDDVVSASPKGILGEVEYYTPTPGTGYYAHLRLAGSGASANGGTTRYEIAGPDWKATAHVTEPSVGGSPDVVVEPFVMTSGAAAFVAEIASKF